MQLLLIPACAAIVTLAAVFLLRRYAPRLGLMANRSVPLSGSATVATGGGLAIMSGIVTVFAVLAVASGPTASLPGGTLFVLLAGALALAAIGCWDDVSSLTPARKLCFQLLVAGAVVLGGVKLTSAVLPLVGTVTLAPTLAFVVTVSWLVLVSNAINLADGADGIAAGVAGVAALALLGSSIAAGRDDLSLILVGIVCVLVVFLFFNFPPATLIMGDTGSLSLGFLLGGLVVVGGSHSDGGPELAAIALIFAFPLLDTALAVIRRFLSHAAIARADRGHIHDRLRELGLSPRRLAVAIYVGSGSMAILGFLLTRSDGRVASSLLLLSGACAALVAIRMLRFPELAEAARIIRSFRQRRRVIGRSVEVTRRSGCLRDAADLEEIQIRLASIFVLLDFDQAELWVSRSWLPADLPPSGTDWEADGSGVRWQWHRSEIRMLSLERCSELKLPVLDGQRRQVGRLTFRRSLRDRRSVEIAVLADELVPALGEALERATALPIPMLVAEERERWAG